LDLSFFGLQALTYSQAAAAVRGCSYRVQPPVEAGQLPFGGAATARKINDILSTGTCRELEQFRCAPAATAAPAAPAAHMRPRPQRLACGCRANLPVQDSKGNARPGTDGATSRASFMRLPGVGAVVAGQWWRRGLRTLEDAEAAALSARDPLPLNAAQRFSLLHRGELLRGTGARLHSRGRGGDACRSGGAAAAHPAS
jgi:DNA polymerase/3'-5' exonuclease PolX